MIRHPQFDCDVPAPCAQCAALRAESDGRHTANLALCEEMAALRADNERLRAELAEATRWKSVAYALESASGELGLTRLQIAAAHALLERWHRCFANYAQDPPVAETIAHLAGQPAAPPRCQQHDAALANVAFFRCGCRYVNPVRVAERPAAPSAIQAQSQSEFGEAAAEQRVLDACAGLTITVNECGPPSRMGLPVIVSPTDGVAEAELARRESK